MTEINRRALLGAAGVAGVGLALAGCHNGAAENTVADNATPVPGNSVGAVGECPNWGASINSTNSPYFNNFVAKLLCVVYLKFGVGVGPIVRQAYLTLNGGEAQTDLDKMAQQSLEKLANKDENGFYAVRHNFDRFSFDRPAIIYMLIDNSPNEAKFNEDPTNLDSLNHVIRFTEIFGISLHDPALGILSYQPANANTNFFDLQRLEWKSTSLKGNVAYRFAFLNVDGNGNSPNVIYNHPNTWLTYSMNISVLVAPGLPPSGVEPIWLPMVFDPDTGNMGSRP